MNLKYWVVRISAGAMLLIGACVGPRHQGGGENLRKADRAYAAYDYDLAGELYSAVLRQEPEHVQANYRLGICYMELVQPEKALPHLQLAYKKDPQVADDILVLLGDVHQQLYEFEQASAFYHAELSRVSRAEGWNKQFLQKRLRECQAGIELSANPVPAETLNLGPAINSEYSDFVPVLLPGDTLLLYTTRRPVREAGMLADVLELIHVSELKQGKWQPSEPFLTPDHKLPNHAVVSVAPHGEELYTYYEGKGGGLFMSKKEGAGWSAPERLGSPFNEGALEPSMHVTDDGKFAFFSSDRAGGYGGLDLYLSYRLPDGGWSEALNLGPAINSPYDEDAPFVDVTTNTLYFSSKGHNSMGGYDIFKSEIRGSVWSQAQNLGVPVNSPFDDIYFSLDTRRKKAYFSSDRPGGYGRKDIYEIAFY